MNKYEKAIRYFEEHLAVLENHCKHGGDFALEARDHTRTAIKALRKQVPRAFLGGGCPNCHIPNDGDEYCFACGQALSPEITDCVSRYCSECDEYSGNKVCPLYADKVDEIRRIHEEVGNES